MKGLGFIVAVGIIFSGCGDVNGGSGKDAVLIRALHGEWVVKSVIQLPGNRPTSKDHYVGKTIHIAAHAADCLVFSAVEPKYELEEIRCSHEEGEVPSKAYKRTSAFELYEQARKVVCQINVYDSKGNYCGALEFIKEKEQIVIMGTDCLLIAERRALK